MSNEHKKTQEYIIITDSDSRKFDTDYSDQLMKELFLKMAILWWLMSLLQMKKEK